MIKTCWIIEGYSVAKKHWEPLREFDFGCHFTRKDAMSWVKIWTERLQNLKERGLYTQYRVAKWIRG